MATTHKICPCTKYINIKLYHFYDYAARGDIQVLPISTKFQLADYLTKSFPEEILLPL